MKPSVLSAYSPFKLVHHPEMLDALRHGDQPAPLTVQIILSDLCNQSCSFCAYRMDGYTSNQNFGVLDPTTGIVNNNPARMLPYDKAIEILDDCVEMGVKAIEFTGGGEPTVHPRHQEIFEAAADRGLDFALVTNGMLLNSESVATLGRAAWVRFSIDAGLPETYSSIRRVPVGTLRRVQKHLKAVTSSAPRPAVVGVSYVVLKENYREIELATWMARDLGADYIRLSAVFTPEDAQYYSGIYEQVLERCRKAALVAAPGFRVFNQFGVRMNDLVQQNPDYEFCGHMHVSTYIGADQNVYRCCALAYNDRGLIGSLKDQRFKELWSSGDKQADFQRFDARGCVRCPFNSKNRFINYCLDMDPLHVNYV